MSTFDPRTVHPTHPHHVGRSFTGPQQYGQTYPGHQYPGSVPAPALAKASRKRPLAGKIVAGFVAAAVVAGGAGAWMAFSGPSASAAVQATSFAGANPTTSPFGTDAPQVAAVAATGPQAGDTAGLYAATTPPACTTADFLRQLQADPAKLAGFGGVFGLGANDVPAFVNSLSPVVLRANTSVTDHPFQDGTFVEQPAILAAGTAVLVNSYGEPTVKCFNGNPLTGGAPLATAVSVIPTDQVISSFQFTSIDNSRVVVVPGKDDPKPNKGHNPDPFLAAKAEAAKQLAENARKDATTARDEATKAADAQKTAQTALDGANKTLTDAQNELNQAFLAFPPDPARVQRAQAALGQAGAAQAKAAGDLAKATKDAQDANKKAKDLEDQATADEQAAAKATQDAEDSTHPHKKEDTKDENQHKPVEAKVEKDPTAGTGTEKQTTATEGQTGPAEVQKPGTLVQPCPAVVTDTTATPECKLPVGSADAVQKAPTTEGTTTGTGTTGSSSQGSGSGKTSSNSNSSSTSQGSAKGGSDK